MDRLQALSDIWEYERLLVTKTGSDTDSVNARIEVSLEAAQTAVEVSDQFRLSQLTWRQKLEQVFRDHLEIGDTTNPSLEPAVREFADLQHALQRNAHVSRKRSVSWDDAVTLTGQLERVLSVLCPTSFFENKEAIDAILAAANE